MVTASMFNSLSKYSWVLSIECQPLLFVFPYYSFSLIIRFPCTGTKPFYFSSVFLFHPHHPNVNYRGLKRNSYAKSVSRSDVLKDEAPLLYHTIANSIARWHEYVLAKILLPEGPRNTMDSILASCPASPGSILGVHKNFLSQLCSDLMLALLITVDRGLIKSIEPIKCQRDSNPRPSDSDLPRFGKFLSTRFFGGDENLLLKRTKEFKIVYCILLKGLTQIWNKRRF